MADAGTPARGLTARAAGLIGCRVCGKVSPADLRVCPRCESELKSRTPASLQRVWAWLIVGLMCYIPANLLPMLITSRLGRTLDSTIVGGVIELFEHHAYFVAGVILLASVVIPIAKFLVISYLAYSIRFRVSLPIGTRIHLYEFVEFIGRWSMVDVFVIAILTALVQMGFLASINPGPAAVFFALSVAFTMLSALSLDPRLIWDAAEREAGAHD